MTCTDLVKETVLKLSDETFDNLKDCLGERKSFYYYANDITDPNLPLHVCFKKDVTKELLAEKICDYYWSLRVSYESPRDFERMLKAYYKDLESIVDSRIAEMPKPGKNSQDSVTVPRARRYFERALQIRKDSKMDALKLIEYTRIIICLYVEIINQKMNVISDFNYSPKCIQPQIILSSMDQEKNPNIPLLKRPLFDTRSWNSDDRSTYTLLILCLYSIIDRTVQGEYYND